MSSRWHDGGLSPNVWFSQYDSRGVRPVGGHIFTAAYKQELDKITNRYEQKQAALLPILHWIQEQEGLISPQTEKDVGEYLGVPPVHVHEVVSFYHLFHQTKKGRCHFAVCQTTACALRGSEEIIQYLKERLGIGPGETTPDGKFSFDTVECLGACEIAPVMQQHKEFVGCLDKLKIDEIIDRNS